MTLVLCLVTQSCLTLCDPVNSSPPSSSVRGILQASLLEWVAISSSRGSSWPRDWTCVSCISASAGSFFTTEPPASFAIAICYSCSFLFAKSANPTCNVTCLWILSVCQRINHWAFSTIKYLVWGFLLYICLFYTLRENVKQTSVESPPRWRNIAEWCQDLWSCLCCSLQMASSSHPSRSNHYAEFYNHASTSLGLPTYACISMHVYLCIHKQCSYLCIHKQYSLFWLFLNFI